MNQNLSSFFQKLLNLVRFSCNWKFSTVLLSDGALNELPVLLSMATFLRFRTWINKYRRCLIRLWMHMRLSSISSDEFVDYRMKRKVERGKYFKLNCSHLEHKKQIIISFWNPNRKSQTEHDHLRDWGEFSSWFMAQHYRALDSEDRFGNEGKLKFPANWEI